MALDEVPVARVASCYGVYNAPGDPIARSADRQTLLQSALGVLIAGLLVFARGNPVSLMSCEPAIRANQASKVFALGLTGRKISLATIAKNWTRMIPLRGRP